MEGFSESVSEFTLAELNSTGANSCAYKIMQYTISTRCDKIFCQGHNRRDPKIVDKEGHINPNAHFEIWEDIPVRELYNDYFKYCLEDYNKQQCTKGHPGRQIEDYYMHVKNSKQQNVAYEMIAAVGNKRDRPDDETCRQILKEYADNWERRNPNLIIAGMYYHADEEGTPHVHITFVPVARYEKGLKMRNGWKKALQQQGFEGKNPQIAWAKSENEYLERICREKDLEICHPQKGLDVIHQNTADYKASMQRVEEQLRDVNVGNTELSDLERDLETCQKSLDEKVSKGFSKKVSISLDEKCQILDLFRHFKEILQLQKSLNTVYKEQKKYMKKISEAIREYQRNFFDERKKLDEREKGLDLREKRVSEMEDKIKNETLDETLARSRSEIVLEKARKWDEHVAKQQRHHSKSR